CGCIRCHDDTDSLVCESKRSFVCICFQSSWTRAHYSDWINLIEREAAPRI
ncbi:hypothetical protein MKW94_005004, partial [Papaver nudicaule]|nr:hypothetical protein [Papaver nudicaule]